MLTRSQSFETTLLYRHHSTQRYPPRQSNDFFVTSLRAQPISCLDDPIKPRHSFLHFILGLGLGTGLGIHSFVKVPRPGNSKVTFSVFELSCHLLLPV